MLSAHTSPRAGIPRRGVRSGFSGTSQCSSHHLAPGQVESSPVRRVLGPLLQATEKSYTCPLGVRHRCRRDGPKEIRQFSEKKCFYWFFKRKVLFKKFIDLREEGGEKREREKRQFVFHSLMRSLVASCMCPDLQPCKLGWRANQGAPWPGLVLCVLSLSQRLLGIDAPQIVIILNLLINLNNKLKFKTS